MIRNALLAALLTLPVTALESTDVFIAGQDGYHTYRIPAIITAADGTLLAFCEGRKNSAGDSGDIDLLLKRSADNGRTWQPRQLIWSDGTNTCGNPAPVLDRHTGVIWLLMTWNLGAEKEDRINYRVARDTRRVFVTSSADHGRTWQQPVEITGAVKRPEWGWYATGPVNGIQLARGPFKGRLVIPCNHSSLTTASNVVTRSHVIYSDNHGKSWRIGGIEEEKTNESTVVELEDNSLMHNMRSYHQSNRRAVARSRDGGLSWEDFRLDDTLVEPVCQASILRYTWSGAGEKSRIVFSNPASRKREKMTLRISYDEGGTWPVSKEIYPGPAAYSCLISLPGRKIGCLYERGVKNPYARITLAVLGLEELE